MTESESQVVVEDHGEFVSAKFPDGTSQTLSWSDICRFQVETNDSGPGGWDVWFRLIGARDELAFPLGATGEDSAFERLESVTGKPRSELIDGMNCTENKVFVTWRRDSAKEVDG